MNGPDAAAQRLADWLTDTVGNADWMAAYATQQGFDAAEIGSASLVVPYDPGPLALEQWPAVYVTMGDLLGVTPVELRTDASQTYRATYAVTVWSMVRHETFPEVQTLRNRYVLAVRQALLSRVQLAPAPTYGSSDYGQLGDDVQILRPTLRENYSPPFVDSRHGGVIGGARTAVQMVVGEIVPGPETLGTAESVSLQITPDLVTGDDTGGLPPVWGP